MTAPIASVVRIAATPQQAHLFVALLQAEGIPAHVDGDSLADEVAMSRKLMNLAGTRVLVPTACLERAREVLGDAGVDERELEAQALAAEAPESEAPQPPPADARRRNVWPLLLAIATAAGFCALWLDTRAALAPWLDLSDRVRPDPLSRMEPIPSGMREVRVADGKVLGEYFDRDGDGSYEEIVGFQEDAQRTTATDGNRDARYESFVEHRRNGTVCRWSDGNGDGLMDLCVVSNEAGKELQRLRWVDGTGFVLETR